MHGCWQIVLSLLERTFHTRCQIHVCYLTRLTHLYQFYFYKINLDKIKTEYDKSKEKELLQEMLEVVEKREQLISDVEDAKKR